MSSKQVILENSNKNHLSVNMVQKDLLEEQSPLFQFPSFSLLPVSLGNSNTCLLKSHQNPYQSQVILWVRLRYIPSLTPNRTLNVELDLLISHQPTGLHLSLHAKLAEFICFASYHEKTERAPPDS